MEDAKRFGADEVYTPDELPPYYMDEPGKDIGFQSAGLGFKTVMEWGETNESLESYVSIRRIKRGRRGWKEISFKQFCSLFKKGNMVIHDEYDSKLTNWKMFQLNACTNWSNIELFITDILDVEFLE